MIIWMIIIEIKISDVEVFENKIERSLVSQITATVLDENWSPRRAVVDSMKTYDAKLIQYGRRTFRGRASIVMRADS